MQTLTERQREVLNALYDRFAIVRDVSLQETCQQLLEMGLVTMRHQGVFDSKAGHVVFLKSYRRCDMGPIATGM